MSGIIRTRGRAALVAAVLALTLPGCAMDVGMAGAPAAGDSRSAPAFNQAQFDQMLAPIALYPDALLSQVLMASTYPLEVVEAARWSQDYSGYQGDDAVRAVGQYDWDPSVKSLVAFPRIVQAMNQNLEWTEGLGNAFLSQQAQVMDTIQKLRWKAYRAGTLRSNREIRVVIDGRYIHIYYADPDFAYAPYYDTTVVYGAWWWADYPPVYWAPWPGYYVVSGYGWGSGVRVSRGFFFGDCDWRYRRVDVVNVRNYYYAPSPRRPDAAAHYANAAPGAWRHNPEHRRGVPYRSAQLRQEYGRVYDRGGERRDTPRYQNPPATYGREGGYGAPVGGAGRDRQDNRFAPGAAPRQGMPERSIPQNMPGYGAPVIPTESRAPQRTWNQLPAQGQPAAPGGQGFGRARDAQTQPGFQGRPNFPGQPAQPPQGGAPVRTWNREASQPAPEPQRFQGQPGSQGQPGFQSQQGSQGQHGFQGQPGSQSQQGSQGQPGFQGQQGSQGQHGFQGQPGSQGQPGFQSQQGSQGQPGFQSQQGSQGHSGAQQQPGFQSDQHSAGQPAQPPMSQTPQSMQSERGDQRGRGFGESQEVDQGGAGWNGGPGNGRGRFR